MSDWCRSRAAQAFLRQHPDEPRNVYEKDPEAVREQFPDVGEQILTLIPENSNDYWLDATLSDLLGWLPDDLAVDAREIFIARTPGYELQAEAWATSSEARLVAVCAGIVNVLICYAVLMRKSYQALRDAERTGVATIRDAMASARERIPEILADRAVALILRSRRDWFEKGVSLDDPLLEVLGEWNERTSNGTLTVIELEDVGEHFIVAHEVAHHLLGHTHSPTFPTRSHPAKAHLEAARGRLRVEVSDAGWNARQLDELDADALAFLAIANELKAPGAFDPSSWYRAMTGALLALPALEDVGLAAQTPDDGWSETHPPIEARLAQIFQFIVAFPAPDKNRPHHPIGLAAQAIFFRDVLTAARDAASSGPSGAR